jgi:hypothetical protein
MKKMMSMMMAGFFMKLLSMVPIAIAGLYVLAGKALIVSKIALLLAGIIGLKKIVAQNRLIHLSRTKTSSIAHTLSINRLLQIPPQLLNLCY